MSPEASWQASSAERHQPLDRASDLNLDSQSVESLLRRLITRVEESERRYGEALGELHARLDRLSKSTDTIPSLGDSEEAETLERLRSQLSGLAERLEPPAPAAPRYEGFAKLDKVLSEAREETAGLARAGNPFATLEKAIATAGMPAGHLGVDTQRFSPSAIEIQPAPAADTSIDRRMVEMVERLERSIAEAVPTAAIQSINARMDELARSFDHALRDTPKLENLRSLERQISDMGQQLGEIGAQASRIGLVEGQLHRLMERAEDPAHTAEAVASKAASEAARLVLGQSFGGQSAAERLDALHRDIVAMNEESRATDNRLVDTLAAMHESLKGLIQQVERVRQTNQAQAAAVAQQRKDPQPAPAPSMEALPRAEGRPQTAKVQDSQESALRDRLVAAETERKAAFERSKRDFFADDALDLDAGDMADDEAGFPMVDASMSGDDLVAAARRAAQAAAARAEGRSQKIAKAPRDEAWTAPVAAEVPERRKRSLLMIVAILLLLLSAGLLYGRLKSKPVEALPPSAAETVVPPAAEAPNASPSSEAAPAQGSSMNNAAPEVMAPVAPAAVIPVMPEVAAPEAPVTVPDDSEPAPMEAQPAAPQDAAPRPEQVAPHSITPSAAAGTETPPVRVSGAPTVLVSGIATTPGSEVAKSSGTLAAQPATLKTDGGLPADVSLSVSEPGQARGASAAPSDGPGPAALRQAAGGGDARAQYVLALLYSDAKANPPGSTSPNWVEAAHLLSLAASQGLAPAQYRLAVLYERGDGVGKDIGKAKSWYQRAAEQGNVKAMHNLAVVVSRESGNADFALAGKWFSEAASYGLADSQFNLGVLAEHGLGRDKSLEDAYKWYALAALSHDLGAIKHRDMVKAKLSPAASNRAEAAVKNWTARPANLAANEVALQPSWRTVSTGAGAAEIARAQTLLNKLGYNAGDADGAMGEKTREAIKVFELRTGMDETGEVSAQLLTRLERLAG